MMQGDCHDEVASKVGPCSARKISIHLKLRDGSISTDLTDDLIEHRSPSLCYSDCALI